MSKIAHLIVNLIRPVDSELWAQDIAKNGAQGECKPLVVCKECKHRPKRLYEDDRDGFNLEFPDERCPCQCSDGWYNWMPDDDWFCGNGEVK